MLKLKFAFFPKYTHFHGFVLYLIMLRGVWQPPSRWKHAAFLPAHKNETAEK